MSMTSSEPGWATQGDLISKKFVFLILEPKFLPSPVPSCWVVTILLFLWKLFSTNKRKESNDQTHRGHCCCVAVGTTAGVTEQQGDHNESRPSGKVVWKAPLFCQGLLLATRTKDSDVRLSVSYSSEVSLRFAKGEKIAFPKKTAVGAYTLGIVDFLVTNSVISRKGWPAFSSCHQVHTNSLKGIVISFIHTNDL